MSEDLGALEQKLLELNKKVTEARRRHWAGPVGEYTFQTTAGPLTLAELFGDRTDLIVVHNMGRSCRYCTLWADGFVGLHPHIESRTAFALSSPDDPATQEAFARERGWPFRMVSTQDSEFAHDMGFEPSPGKYMPGFSAFVKRDGGSVERTGAAFFGPGDEFCGVWHLFDQLEGGQADWKPMFRYDRTAVV